MSDLKQCAYLTMQDIGDFFSYDHLTVEPLRELGWEISEIPWNDPNADWSQFLAVVIRSPWDYQKTPEEFLDVLELIANSGAKLFNPLEICRWNLNKNYLQELATQGVPTIPTVWLDRLERERLPNLFSELNHHQIVVKPTIGAGASETFVLSASHPKTWPPALTAFEQKPLLAQPFVDSIVNEGEFSLFYFGGEFSHAILKRPKPNDFRVQEEHGGIIRSVSIDSTLMQAGNSVIDAIKQTLLYARVDFVRWQGAPALIELELIEPSLYFSYDDQSARRFAAALNRMVLEASQG